VWTRGQGQWFVPDVNEALRKRQLIDEVRYHLGVDHRKFLPLIIRLRISQVVADDLKFTSAHYRRHRVQVVSDCTQ
jgi:hypothetical protein